MIERDDVDAALREAIEPVCAAGRVDHLEAEPRQTALDQPGKAGVIVDIQERRRCGVHVAAGGTCMTEKNNPSWRMALAKLS